MTSIGHLCNIAWVSQPIAPPTLEDLCADLVLYTGRLVRAVTRSTTTAVPTATLRLLSQIDELEPVTLGDLARADRCAQPTLSAAVQGLCEKGWAAKRPNPRDARSSLVGLTPEGATVLATTRRERAAVVARRVAADTEHDEHDLATAVSVLRGLLEHHDDIPSEGGATA